MASISEVADEFQRLLPVFYRGLYRSSGELLKHRESSLNDSVLGGENLRGPLLRFDIDHIFHVHVLSKCAALSFDVRNLAESISPVLDSEIFERKHDTVLLLNGNHFLTVFYEQRDLQNQIVAFD